MVYWWCIGGVGKLDGLGMASHEETSSLSLRHGFRCIPDPSVTVEEVLLAVSKRVKPSDIMSASRMNKAVVVFLRDDKLVNVLVETGIEIKGMFVQATPLFSPSVKVTVSNVPPFIPNEMIQRELSRFGKFASSMRMVSLGCKNPDLKHVLSFRRQVFMFLDSPAQTLDISLRITHDNKSYMIYATTGSPRCFLCGDLGHIRVQCPKQPADSSSTGNANAGSEAANEVGIRTSRVGL